MKVSQIPNETKSNMQLGGMHREEEIINIFLTRSRIKYDRIVVRYEGGENIHIQLSAGMFHSSLDLPRDFIFDDELFTQGLDELIKASDIEFSKNLGHES